MKQGTISILVGCHSPIHSLLVLKAWINLYHSFPVPWEMVCIAIHDWGHIGRQYLDNLDDKKSHWVLGARIAKFLFGQKGFNLCAGHCEYSGLPRSKLYKPDKMSQLHPYLWSYIYQTFEPKLSMGYSKREAWERFQKQVKKSVESGVYRSSHEMYLERCKERLC